MTKIIITIILGLIAATLVGVWYFSNIDTDMAGVEQKMMDEVVVVSTSTNPNQIKGVDSLAFLIKLGKSMECTFLFSSVDTRGEGTAYFDKGMARIDSLYSGLEGGPKASYIIHDVNTNMMYSWFLVDGALSGIKMNIPTETVASDTTSTPTTTLQVRTNTAVNYDCKPWNVDRSVFVPPANVEFRDDEIQKMQEDMQNGMTMPDVR